ncbi:calmodulin-binding protein 25-like [Triticum dicoccoides]|uniref:calmodulin-binding protein 25-like n=1 Tax=Triticum dicoccoides TaxID=85692 RepID=UPI00188F0F29|nr:calmodulin-binding protein 25-like [Triticum dicoccoides]
MDAMSCLGPPPSTSFLSPYYTDAAIMQALHFSSMSMPEHEHAYSPAVSSPSSASAPSSSSLLPDFPGGGSWFASTASPPTGSLACDSVAPSTPVGAATNKRRVGLGPNAAVAGRVGKRRARPSKRAPTTYISTDAVNFRLMVQHVTGAQAEPTADGALLPASVDASSASALLDGLPFDGAFGDALRLPSDVDAEALHRHHHQQQHACYPTLDSWSVMCESSQL